MFEQSGYSFAFLIAILILNSAVNNFINRCSKKENDAKKSIILFIGHVYSFLFCVFLGMLTIKLVDDWWKLHLSLSTVFTISMVLLIMILSFKTIDKIKAMTNKYFNF